MSDATNPHFLVMAEDELKRALTIRYRDLAKITPWGDTFEGISPDGRNVEVERNYLWASAPGGDILVEIAVFGGPSRYDTGAKVSRVIPKSA